VGGFERLGHDHSVFVQGVIYSGCEREEGMASLCVAPRVSVPVTDRYCYGWSKKKYLSMHVLLKNIIEKKKYAPVTSVVALDISLSSTCHF
jgi:hypothetical protein